MHVGPSRILLGNKSSKALQQTTAVTYVHARLIRSPVFYSSMVLTMSNFYWYLPANKIFVAGYMNVAVYSRRRISIASL